MGNVKEEAWSEGLTPKTKRPGTAGYWNDNKWRQECMGGKPAVQTLLQHEFMNPDDENYIKEQRKKPAKNTVIPPNFIKLNQKKLQEAKNKKQIASSKGTSLWKDGLSKEIAGLLNQNTPRGVQGKGGLKSNFQNFKRATSQNGPLKATSFDPDKFARAMNADTESVVSSQSSRLHAPRGGFTPRGGASTDRSRASTPRSGGSQTPRGNPFGSVRPQTAGARQQRGKASSRGSSTPRSIASQTRAQPAVAWGANDVQPTPRDDQSLATSRTEASSVSTTAADMYRKSAFQTTSGSSFAWPSNNPTDPDQFDEKDQFKARPPPVPQDEMLAATFRSGSRYDYPWPKPEAVRGPVECHCKPQFKQKKYGVSTVNPDKDNKEQFNMWVSESRRSYGQYFKSDKTMQNGDNEDFGDMEFDLDENAGVQSAVVPGDPVFGGGPWDARPSGKAETPRDKTVRTALPWGAGDGGPQETPRSSVASETPRNAGQDTPRAPGVAELPRKMQQHVDVGIVPRAHTIKGDIQAEPQEPLVRVLSATTGTSPRLAQQPTKSKPRAAGSSINLKDISFVDGLHGTMSEYKRTFQVPVSQFYNPRPEPVNPMLF